eukprot:371656-Hanusia_phi.AAC.1
MLTLTIRQATAFNTALQSIPHAGSSAKYPRILRKGQRPSPRTRQAFLSPDQEIPCARVSTSLPPTHTQRALGQPQLGPRHAYQAASGVGLGEMGEPAEDVEGEATVQKGREGGMGGGCKRGGPG